MPFLPLSAAKILLCFLLDLSCCDFVLLVLLVYSLLLCNAIIFLVVFLLLLYRPVPVCSTS